MRSPLFRVLFTTAYATGMRIHEGCALEIGHIDAARGVIRIVGKGHKERFVMLSPRLLAILRAYWKSARPTPPYMFVSPRTD